MINCVTFFVHKNNFFIFVNVKHTICQQFKKERLINLELRAFFTSNINKKFLYKKKKKKQFICLVISENYLLLYRSNII